ncbi:glycosyltransferase [Massilia terrae]|uniref:Glycosyltransferase n=1 Tax=Massilia terrae TaxID=1811224 RepID=A0ABT2CWH9_9BURK|nr:glycosyltransferase [Massilia terrae]MCS0657458.1 glycosyltransferase [Massilia terrae]
MPDTVHQPPLVVHLVNQLEPANTGNGLVSLIAHMPPERYRHAIVCLHDSTDTQAAGRERGVDIIRLHQSGNGLSHDLLLYKALRALQPDVVHTRNLSGLRGQMIAALAGVKLRVHAEHGRERAEGLRPGHRWLRRLLRPLVGHFVAVSPELEHWLIEQVGAEPARVSHISNGVDSVQFHPRLGPPAAIGPDGFMHDSAFVIGSIGQMDAAHSHSTLVEAFLRLIASPHAAHQKLRLMIIGDGPCRAECQSMLNRAGAAHRAWLPGDRSDIPQLLRAMDLFVLPSLSATGSATLLEAMATGLPVVATDIAAHTGLVHPGFTGILVPSLSPDLMAAAIADYCRIPEMGARHGARARSQVIARHSLPAMARSYLAVYDGLTRQREAAVRKPA